MAIDREENHDVAAANPTIVKDLLDIIAGYAKTEVSIEEAGRLGLLRLPALYFYRLEFTLRQHSTRARWLIHAYDAVITHTHSSHLQLRLCAC